jgi:hypothetical protein
MTMIILKGYETLVKDSQVDLVGNGMKEVTRGILYLTNTRLVFETDNATILRDILSDHIQLVEPVNDHEFAVSYSGHKTGKASRDVYRVVNRNILKEWIDAFKNILGGSSISDS